MADAEQITAWLTGWRQGDEHARDRLFTIIQPQLRQIAAHLLERERPDHTLEPTALVNELCIRLLGNQPVSYQDRAHFVAIAAQTMRRILIDHARAGLTGKRGGKQQRLTLSAAAELVTAPDGLDLLALDATLSKLEALDARAAKVVELRFFGGLQEEEVAAVLGVSVITVKRDWKAARAWLAGRLQT